MRDPTRRTKTSEQGAATGVWCARQPAARRAGGVHCENGDVGSPESAADAGAWYAGGEPPGVPPYAVAPGRGRLREVSERLTA